MKRYLYIFKNSKLILCFFALLNIVFSSVILLDYYMNAVVIDTVIYSDNFDDVLKVILLYFIIGITGAILKFFVKYLRFSLIEKFIYKFKISILEHLQSTNLIEYNRLIPANLSKQIDDDTRQYISFIINNYTEFFIVLIEIFVITIILFNINFNIGLVSIVLTPIFAVINYFFKRPIRDSSLAYREEEASFFSDFTDQLESMENILIEADLKKEEKIFYNKFNLFYSKFKDNLKILNLFDFTKKFANSFVYFLVIIVGAIAFLNQNITLGLLMISIYYIQRNQSNFIYFININKNYQITKASIVRLDKIMDMEKVMEGKNEISTVDSISAKISFKLENTEILKEKQIFIKKGEVMSISGKNGSGKSTLSKILIGAIKPKEEDDFEIIINNKKPLLDLNTFNFRFNHLSYIPQKIPSTNFKVKEIFHNCEAPQKFLELLKNKNIPVYDDIKSLIIDRWDTKIENLSGGQKQIVCILEKAIEEKSIFILDEPTSNLDRSKFEWFSNMIQNVKKDKIVIIINHEKQIEKIFDTLVYI